jgi:hypothetical protein
MERVKILWTGPYSIDSCIEKLKNYDDFGIYMITRNFGDNLSLLYIGRVYWRTFSERISEHEQTWLGGLRGTVKVRTGRLMLSKGKKHSLPRMDDVEKLLILAHKPSHNKQAIKTCDVRDLTVKNVGRRGPLDSKISTDDFKKL